VLSNYRAKLNDPCDVKTYEYFNLNVRSGQGEKFSYAGQIGLAFEEHPLGKSYDGALMIPKNLCISTDDYNYIDLHALDCVINKLDPYQIRGLCSCGQQLSLIDENFNESYRGRKEVLFYHEWYQVIGLNRLLKMESRPLKTPRPGYNETARELICVASRFGHCTLLDQGYQNRKNFLNETWVITDCAKGYKCQNVSIWNPLQKHPLYNKATDEWWGICVSESTKETSGSPFGNGAESGIFNRERGPTIILICLGILLVLYKILAVQKISL